MSNYVGGTTNSTTSRQNSKYSKVFAQSIETNSPADSSFNPSTIASVCTTRTNAWSNGPPINMTFDRHARTQSVSVNPTPQTQTYDNHQSKPEMGDNDSDTTPILRPSSVTLDIADLVQKAMEKERRELDRQFAALESQQQKFIAKVDQWDQKLQDMRKQIVDTTVQGTMAVFSGAASPFATREDSQLLRKQTAADMQALKEAVTTTNSNMAIIQQSITALIQRTDQLFAANHDPLIPSPPRKTRITGHTISEVPADSPMTEGGGER
jgi:hypothetical protein